jgi:hypothetical protein
MLNPGPCWRWFKLESNREPERSVAVIVSTILGSIARAQQRLHASRRGARSRAFCWKR